MSNSYQQNSSITQQSRRQSSRSASLPRESDGLLTENSISQRSNNQWSLVAPITLSQTKSPFSIEAMDDSCAVCAEPLEWVAYGPCGHHEVCSTCIVRLRFICNDKSCCICKCELEFVFVTKALGNYTRMINDFSALPPNPTEGQVGDYWFHEGAQAYFDDADHFKIIKAMCRLSCNVCEKTNGPRNGESNRSGDFDSIEQLKSHLFHQHKLFMCSLCLEGRKIFISEQKLCNKAQLTQHVKTGNSVVDGSESERGGFTGHLMCEFCQKPFYGDNELYLHMSTEHFTCHICRRLNPGKFEYYGTYDDLETHFRQQHFLCEDDACLSKKFIVFASESEMKRHNALEHKRNMSRSKRNAVLQIPLSFQYQQPAQQDRQGRRHRIDSNSSDTQLSMAIRDNIETSNTLTSSGVPSASQTSHSHRDPRRVGSTANPYELLATIDPEPSSNLRQSSTSPLLEESSFPPLPMAPSNSERKSKKAANSGNTMAARLRNHNTVKILNSSRVSSVSTSSHSRPVLDSSHISSSSRSTISMIKPTSGNNYSQSSYGGSTRSRSRDANDLGNTSKVGHSQQNKTTGSSESLLKVENIGSANTVLVKKVRAALNFDNDKFAAFKLISMEYRQDQIGSSEYLAYVHQFGLEHLVLELAILCPNAQKQRELVEIYNSSNTPNGRPESKKNPNKGKEKCESDQSSEKSLEGLNRKVVDLQLELKSSVKGKSKISVEEEANPKSPLEPTNGNNAWAGNKPRKKVPKFLRNRVGDTSAAAFTESSNGDGGSGSGEKKKETHGKKNPPEMLPVHGVWRNGGGRKLVVMTQRYSKGQ